MTDPTAPGPLAATAALMADAARARMLAALMGGQAMTAGELARVAGIAAPTASGHLARLADGGLVVVHAQGRHRYFRLASEEVAAAIEALGGLAARIAPAGAWTHGAPAGAWKHGAPAGAWKHGAPARPWKHGEAARQARLCWNHLAGVLGVALHQRLTEQRWLLPAAGGWEASPEGRARLVAAGIDLDRAGRARHFACDCMDWSERRPHLAGGLGREMARAWIDAGWLRRAAAQGEGDVLAHRRLALTPAGRHGLREGFGIDLPA